MMLSREPRRAPSRDSRFAKRRGAAVVEFALVAPLFFAIVFGMIEMGRGVMVAQVAGAAAREGVRKTAISTMTVGEAETWVRNYLNGCGVDEKACTITVSQRPANGGGFQETTDLSVVPYGSYVRMTVSVDFGQVSWVPNYACSLLPNGAKIVQMADARKETE